MREAFKSVFLVVLIVSSFVQTGMLLYSSPSYDEIRNGDNYVTPFKISDKYEKQVYELASPQQIMVHQDGKHQALYPENSLYQTLMKKIHYAPVEKASMIQPSDKDWDDLLKKTPGLELRYYQPLPSGVIQTLFSSEIDLSDLKEVTRIWVFVEKEDRVTFWFISDQENKVMETSARIDQFDRWISEAVNSNSAAMEPMFASGSIKEEQGIPKPFYLPKKAMSVNNYVYQLSDPIKIDDMKTALFPNPRLVQSTLVLNKSYIYTDTSRTLQYNTQNHSMIYSNPAPKSSDTGIPAEELDRINLFMLRHGGWTGDYHLERMDEDPNTQLHHYIFRMLVRQFPVYWNSNGKEPDMDLDTIRLSATDQGVSNYERSLYYLLSAPEKTGTSRLPGKDDVLKALKTQGISMQEVRSIHPGYSAVPRQKHVELQPVWVINRSNGKQWFIRSSESQGE
jgi:regulatory protein YycH of two-component signal transduction system YycFG